MLNRSDQEKPSWSLSWHPEGRCDSFTREAILLFAPAVSGVYGLFNCDYQLFIGESPNMLEALLQHEAETNFQSLQLRPTGFTFEPCAAELRKSKVDELIARFHPVLQTEAVLTEISPRLNHPNVSEGKVQPQDLADDALQSEFSLNDSYVVQAEVKGETYYRVRIGHFVAREEAEPLRALLASQEGYQDAYLAGD